MNEETEVIPLEEAKQQVSLVCRRLGLLHLAFAEVLARDLGPEKGGKLLARAIKEYSIMIAEKKKDVARLLGLEATPENLMQLSDLPSIGMNEAVEEIEVEGEKRIRVHGCEMGKVWQERGKGELGRYYCLVDPASAMCFNPDTKWIHTKALPDGDPYCELVMRPTSERDRAEFEKEDTDWKFIEEDSGSK